MLTPEALLARAHFKLARAQRDVQATELTLNQKLVRQHRAEMSVAEVNVLVSRGELGAMDTKVRDLQSAYSAHFEETVDRQRDASRTPPWDPILEQSSPVVRARMHSVIDLSTPRGSDV